MEKSEHLAAFQKYIFDDPSVRLRRFEFAPTTIEVRGADGNWKQLEVAFSRQRVPLPTDMVLERFEIDSNVGGFTGESGSIRDYRSLVRFKDGEDWSAARPISMNKPVEHEGYWFFQSQWDPPDRARFEGDTASLGLNYTVLGVGNRVGVLIQLVGGTLMTLGMLYAFYIKPVLIRRRQDEAIKVARDGGSS